MANTPRLNLRRPVGDDSFDIAGDIEQIVDNAAVRQTGTFAGRPAAKLVPAGTKHRSTDTGNVDTSYGSAWFTLTPAAKAT